MFELKHGWRGVSPPVWNWLVGHVQGMLAGSKLQRCRGSLQNELVGHGSQLFLDGISEGLLAKSSGPQGGGPSGRLVFEGALQRHTHLTTATYLGSLKEATTQRPDRISARCLGRVIVWMYAAPSMSREVIFHPASAQANHPCLVSPHLPE